MSDTKKDNPSLSLITKDSNFHSSQSVFIKNEHHAFVVQKTEKLASAVYVVTTYLSEGEPLRTRLRTCALDTIASATAYFASQGRDLPDNFGSRCLEIGSILKLAERAGHISHMNAEVLCEEYNHLATFVHKHRDQLLSHTVDVGSVRLGSPSLPASSPSGSSKGHIKDIKLASNKRHSHRQSLILELLSKKDKITVNEAAASILGCSEKTIQREIMSLVSDGVLVRDGERRWSTYRMAPASL